MTEFTHRFTQQITIDTPKGNVIDWLVEACSAQQPVSKQQLKSAMTKGAVWLKRQGQGTPNPIRRAKTELDVGDIVSVYYDSSVLGQTPLPPTLLWDSPDYSVWYKPSGMLSHGSKWGDHCAITRWITQNATPQRSCFLVHRLDRAASGIMVIGHNKATTAKLCQLFESRQIDKRYHAIVTGQLAQQQTVIDTPIDNKHAKTIVSILDYQASSQHTLVEVKIDTGRKHQIRQHLCQLGHPIIGDRLYGDKPTTTNPPDLQLRAYYLRFTCPISDQQRTVCLDKSHRLSL